MTKNITPLLPISLLVGIALLSGCSEPVHAATSVSSAEPAPRVVQPEPALVIEQPEPVEPVAEAGVSSPEPAPLPEPTPSVSGVLVRRMLLSRTIEEREPVSPDTVFSASTDRLYAFFDIRNSGAEDADFLVTFEGPGGRSAGHVELTVPAEAGRWRTWAYTRNATEAGEWTAEIHDIDGNLLASREFTIE